MYIQGCDANQMTRQHQARNIFLKENKIDRKYGVLIFNSFWSGFEICLWVHGKHELMNRVINMFELFEFLDSTLHEITRGKWRLKIDNLQ